MAGDLSLTRRGVLASACAAGAFAALPLSRSSADPIDLGEWSSPFSIGGEAIHAALMHTGYIVFFDYIEAPGQGDETSYIGTWDYTTGEVGRADYSYPRDVFCTGHSLLPDGRIFVAGGHDWRNKTEPSAGVAETDIFDPVTKKWTRGPKLSQKRWYPTVVAMPNGLQYVFGGSDLPGKPALSVEVYDSVKKTRRRLGSSADRQMRLYPHMWLMPNGRIARAGGGFRQTMYFNPATSKWSSGPNMMVGNRSLGTSVLLSGAAKVLAFGGNQGGGVVTRTAEIVDLAATKPAWQYTGSLAFGRLHANAVVLPDGKVLAVGGGASGNLDGPVTTAEMYDPATGEWSVMASQVAGRMYHSTALLLPDGRVFSAGQKGIYENLAELYSPPYLFKGPRPVIEAAGTTLRPGQTLAITSPDAARVTQVALVRPGSVTHQINTDQRHLFLPHTVSDTTITATAPTNRNVISPGRWLVFLLDADGVPSVGKWVRVY